MTKLKLVNSSRWSQGPTEILTRDRRHLFAFASAHRPSVPLALQVVRHRPPAPLRTQAAGATRPNRLMLCISKCGGFGGAFGHLRGQGPSSSLVTRTPAAPGEAGPTDTPIDGRRAAVGAKLWRMRKRLSCGMVVSGWSWVLNGLVVSFVVSGLWMGAVRGRGLPVAVHCK